MLKATGIAVAAALLAWPIHGVRADTCYETAQVNIDCSVKSGGAPAQASPSTSQLRELLRQSITNGAAPGTPPPVSAEALAKSIHDAEDHARRALAAATGSADPAQQDRAIKAYNAALKDLDKAYDRAAAEADTQSGRDRLLRMKADDEQALADEANAKFAAQREAAQAAQPKPPDNVGMTDGYVFVCDGPLKSDHVNCREVQQDGKSCVAVIAFDGQVNWRDSTATPCSARDLAQRDAYFAAQDGAQDQARQAAMTAPGCPDLIQNYVNAAQAENGPRAEVAYQELRHAGGCGVLDQAEQQLKAQGAGAGGDPRFATRGDTQMIDQIFGACDQSPQACDAAIAQARAGASPAAIAAIYANAIGIGLQLGGMMGNAMLNAQAANMAHAAALNNAARAVPRPSPQYPRAISCNVRGCITTDGRGPSNNNSDITGLGR